MLVPKHCHRGLQKRVGVFGFELLDLLLALPFLYVPAVLLEKILMGVLLAAGVASALRLAKLGRLPGITTDLFLYLVLGEHSGGLGTDFAPPYPHAKTAQPMAAFYHRE